jgi:ABC-2 type transport system permease protein
MGVEFLAIYWRDMKKFFRTTEMLFASLIQPVFWLALYGLSMSSNFDLITPDISGLTGVVSVNYMTFLAAGIISMTVLFTCLYAGLVLQLDKQFGLLKEMIAAPMPRSHILSGLTLGGITKSVIQTVIIIGFGYVLGVRFFNGFAPIKIIISLLGILLFVGLFALGLMFLSSIIALKIQSHEGVSAVIQFLTLPLFFASNALYPLESMPLAIRIVGYVNPVTYFIKGIRYFSISSEFYAFGTYYSYGINDVLISLAFLAGFSVLMYILASRAVRKVNVA